MAEPVLGEALTEMQKSFADRLAEEKKATLIRRLFCDRPHISRFALHNIQASTKKEKSSDIKFPHIANLNEDLCFRFCSRFEVLQ